MYRNGAILFLSLLWCNTIHSQPQQHWRFWTSADGFEESYGFFVSLSPTGNVLINHGTVNDMSILDGYSVHKIPCPNPYAPVYESPAGELWSVYWLNTLRTIGGFLKYDKVTRQWIRYPVEEMQSSRYPFSFIPITPDRVLFLLPDRLMEFDIIHQQTRTVLDAAQSSLEKFHEMIPASQKGIWIAGKKGLTKISLDNSGIVADYTDYLFDDDSGIQNLKFVTEIDQGKIIGTKISLDEQREVVVRFDGQSWNRLYMADENKNIAGIPGMDDDYWVLQGTIKYPYSFYEFSLSYISEGQETSIQKNRILSDRILDYAIQPEGVFWLGTSKGLARFAPPLWRKPKGLMDADMVCHAIYEDSRNRLWFVCNDKLYLLQNDRWTGPIKIPIPLGGSDTISISALPDGRIAFRAFEQDLLVFNPNREPLDERNFDQISHPQNRAMGFIAPSSDGSIWVETKSRDNKAYLERFDGTNFQTVFELDEGWQIGVLMHFLEAQSGTLWFGGDELPGLAKYCNGEYTIVTPEDGYPGDVVYSIAEVDDGKIWFGGRNSISEFNGEQWSLVRTGLDFIHSMIKSSDGSVWVASSTGVHRYYESSWITYTVEDGLPDASIVEIFEDSQNHIWVGTTQGISRYDPDADEDPPETRISPENIKAIASQGNAQFFFDGLDKWKYTDASRLLFSHRIDGGTWSPFSSSMVASVTNLAAGNHELQVRAMDQNLYVDPSPAKFSFTVALPWYCSPGFLFLFFCGATVTLTAVTFAVSKHLNLEKLVSTRTAELQTAYNDLLAYQAKLRSMASELTLIEERERRRIATDLHDRIGQALAMCQVKVESLQNSDINPKSYKDLELLKNLVLQTINDTRSLTFEICPVMLYELGLIPAVIWLIKTIQQQHNLKIDLTNDGNFDSLNEKMRSLLFRSIRELLINIVKHAHAQQAFVSIQNRDAIIHILVKDNGSGNPSNPYRISSTSTRMGYGLFSIRERIENMGGEFSIETQSGVGTQVTLKVPVHIPEEDDHEHTNSGGG